MLLLHRRGRFARRSDAGARAKKSAPAPRFDAQYSRTDNTKSSLASSSDTAGRAVFVPSVASLRALLASLPTPLHRLSAWNALSLGRLIGFLSQRAVRGRRSRCRCRSSAVDGLYAKGRSLGGHLFASLRVGNRVCYLYRQCTWGEQVFKSIDSWRCAMDEKNVSGSARCWSSRLHVTPVPTVAAPLSRRQKFRLVGLVILKRVRSSPSWRAWACSSATGRR